MNLKNILSEIMITLGVGRIPFAPGTWGSLLALGVAFLLPQHLFVSGLLGLIVIFSLLGTWAIHWHIRYQKALLKDAISDPGYIVVDEAVGLWISLLASQGHWMWMVLGFVLFRLLDIYKPGLIGAIDRLKGKTPLRQAALIMADDVLAGIIAASLLTLAQTIILITI